MAIFQREVLRSKGYTEEQINDLMSMVSAGLKDYLPLNELQGKIDEAIAKLPPPTQPAPIDPTTTEPYQQLVRERDMLRAIGSEDFATVKPKFREMVFGLLDRSENARPVADQLKSIGAKYEEYFLPAAPRPVFGSADQGSMPRGDEGAVSAFERAWGFVPGRQ